MTSFPRAIAYGAPFVATLALAAACSAKGTSLGALVDAPMGPLEPLTQTFIDTTLDDDAFSDVAPGAAAQHVDGAVWQEIPAPKR